MNIIQNMKQTFKNYKPLIIYYAVSTILFVGGTIVAVNSPDPLENYQHYSQLLNSAMGGILGLIIIITIFYSGKIHDYKKDFLRTNGKLETLLNLLVRRFNHLKSIFKEYNEMTKIYDEASKSVEDWQNTAKEHKQLTEDVFKSSKPWFNYLYITIPSALLFGVFNFTSEQTEGIFYLQLAVLGFGTASLIMYWVLNEMTMQTIHKSYDQLLDMLVNSQNLIGRVEDLISTSRKD